MEKTGGNQGVVQEFEEGLRLAFSRQGGPDAAAELIIQVLQDHPEHALHFIGALHRILPELSGDVAGLEGRPKMVVLYRRALRAEALVSKLTGEIAKLLLSKQKEGRVPSAAAGVVTGVQHRVAALRLVQAGPAQKQAGAETIVTLPEDSDEFAALVRECREKFPALAEKIRKHPLDGHNERRLFSALRAIAGKSFHPDTVTNVRMALAKGRVFHVDL